MSTLADELKLEIGLPDDFGDNLLTNTSGQYGAWQWQRAANSSGVSITGDPDGRTITISRNQTQGWTAVTTDYLSITAGAYANARIDVLAIESAVSHKVTLALEFYDTAYSSISWQYSSPVTEPDTLAFSSVEVPASAVWARLVVILDQTNDPLPGEGTATPDASMTFTRAMLTELETTGVPSIVTTNLMPNGGFQYTLDGWAPGTNIGAIERYSTGSGQYHLRAKFVDGVTLGSGEYLYVNGPYVPIEAGENYSLRADTYLPGGLPEGHLYTTGVLFRWFNDAGDVIGGDNRLTDGTFTTGWHQVWKIITAPAGATKFRMHPWLRHHGPEGVFSDAWAFMVDSISLVKSSVLMPYFDGDTPDTSSHVYEWTGTPGNSPSTRASVGAVDYVETDEQYLDILAGVVDLSLERVELDVSTFNARLVDVALSPARAGSVVRPGRRFRLLALDEAGTWQRLFTGILGPPTVAYEPLADERRLERDPGRVLNISVTGTGHESILAQATRPDVTRTPANLPDLVLAGAGVPWDVNGSRSTVGGVVGIATNENATALDQVALTRDTVSGIAKVHADGTLVFRSSPSTEIVGTLDENAYTADGLKVSFDTSRVINAVTIVRVIRASDGSTEERTHGPFENAASIKAWGRQAATVTIASVPDDTDAAADRAAAILAANGDPELIIEEIAVNSADNRQHAFYDLYDLVHANATTVDGIIDVDVRIVRIRHEITTARRRFGNWGTWRTVYGFMNSGAIAAPAVLPPPAYGTPDDWTDIPLRAGFTAVNGETPQYRKDGSVVWLRGRVQGSFTTSNTPVGDLPEGFRPTANNELWATCLNAATPARFFVSSSGSLNINAESAASGTVAISTSYRTD